ncbi:pyridine nucleotide-disulfide oxidoreductase domain-containing protein 1 [Anoplophora glabripennis]|uniref:pyridine nucleotide-disulfide oxidoreductase domain-containing protein 1 n=1 Tax=Anoplophora glabripennis TaxID=217634 RepID=UPI0008753476|nr:pyridine nucleotide-disulfide oxidoreductase domain-containing protein 1 [Anoplophora glabripennis]
MEAVFVIVGGGIAGVTCAETLAFFEPEKSIILLSESSLIKTVTNLHAITKILTNFDIKEISAQEFSTKHSNITVIHDTLIEINDEEHFIKTKDSKTIKYQYLCLCTGAEPKLIPQANEFPEILGIRDTDSVESVVQKVKESKKIIIVGNGGIASELVYKIQNAEIHWVIKDRHIAATFVDPGAAEFFQPSLEKREMCEPPVSKRMRYKEEEFKKSGAALGPDWYKNLIINGANAEVPSSVTVHYQSEVSSVKKPASSVFPLEVNLTDGEKIDCDLVISATGVSARRNFTTKNNFELSEDGGIQVNEYMQTNLLNIYAAGDICSANWPVAKHWFQMKLWTQARQMGCYAAKSMVGHLNGEEVLQDFCFEMFAHSTRLFGYKVILLGLFNGQKLGTNYEILLRMTKGLEYIKFVLENDKLQGAVLIGDTDLEEMAENLILNQIDLSPYGDDILNPDIDIEDYFD